mgnify:CR=1 FL=1
MTDMKRSSNLAVAGMDISFPGGNGLAAFGRVLYRGLPLEGRINGASRFFGTALEIKPILFFNEEGKIDALERVRTKKKALQRLISLVEEKAAERPVRIGITHANVAQEAQAFHDEIIKRLDCLEIFTVELSPVIGVHVGPGAIGVSVYVEE